MYDALREVGWVKALRYVLGQFQIALLMSNIILPPLRRWLLRLFGAHIGKATVVHPCRFINVYRTGFRGLTLGHHCFIGEECLLDLADAIRCGDHVTLAERVTILTHTNVGYRSHPLQRHLPSTTAPVQIGMGTFIGTNTTVLPGVTIGQEAIIGAASFVRESVPDRNMVAGVPAHVIRTLP